MCCVMPQNEGYRFLVEGGRFMLLEHLYSEELHGSVKSSVERSKSERSSPSSSI